MVGKMGVFEEGKSSGELSSASEHRRGGPGAAPTPDPPSQTSSQVSRVEEKGERD